MKLFYVPGGCSLSVHIVLKELERPCELVSINLDKRTSDQRDFLRINPKGFVPALEFDDGSVLAEALALLVYLAEDSGRLLAPSGMERWRTLETLSFMTSEVHGNFKPFWKKAEPPQLERSRLLLHKHFDTLAAQLGQHDYLMGAQMSIADPYLFVMLHWATIHGVAMPPLLQAFAARMKGRPAVARALADEGLQ